MKQPYAILFVTTMIVLCIASYLTRNNKQKMSYYLRRVLIVAAADTLANLIMMYTESEIVFMWASAVFSAGITWLLCYLMLFVIQYTNNYYSSRIVDGVAAVILFFDTASMLLNPILGHAYGVQTVTLETGELFYRIDAYGFYHFHLICSYFLVALVLFRLFVKAFRAPKMYRKKYVVVILILVGIVLGDAVYVFLNGLVDISVICFAVAGLAIYYFAINYVPNDLLNRLMKQVSQGMTDAMIMFDVDGKCVHANAVASQMFHIANDKVVFQQELFHKWIEGKDLSKCQDFEEERTEHHDGQDYHLKVAYHRLEDAKGHFLGSFWEIRDCTEEIRELEWERFRATHDMLTSLYNREHFFEKAYEMLEANPDTEYVMVCSDIHNFKLINDIFGKETGDKLLRRIAKALKEYTTEQNVYGRLENDRFALLMQKGRFKESTFVDQPREVEQLDPSIAYAVHIYVGVYEIVDRNIPVSIMCDRAQMAITSIKGSYDTKVAYYNEKIRNSVLKEQEVSAMMEEALTQGQFYIYLQPQMDSDGITRGGEALVRWIHPERGMIMPGDFIPVFEQNGMISMLDQHVWELACAQLQQWAKQGKKDWYISVNISARDFYFLDIYEVFTDLVKRYDVDPKCLKLEITETAVMMELEKQLELIERLRKAGFIVEMDDFGSGYSSLNMLKDINVDVLKIDMNFLRKTKDEERSRIILRSIVELSKSLGIQTITEGVETREQVDFLTEFGCNMFQGYYFAKPMPVADFEAKYMAE